MKFHGTEIFPYPIWTSLSALLCSSCATCHWFLGIRNGEPPSSLPHLRKLQRALRLPISFQLSFLWIRWLKGPEPLLTGHIFQPFYQLWCPPLNNFNLYLVHTRTAHNMSWYTISGKETKKNMKYRSVYCTKWTERTLVTNSLSRTFHLFMTRCFVCIIPNDWLLLQVVWVDIV